MLPPASVAGGSVIDSRILSGCGFAIGLRVMPHGAPSLPPLRCRCVNGPIAHDPALCGCHVHVGVPDRALAIQVCNAIRAWLPVVQAITGDRPEPFDFYFDFVLAEIERLEPLWKV